MNTSEMQFKSAVDNWFYWLIAGIAILVAVLVYPQVESNGLMMGISMLLLSVLLAIGIPVWVMLTTRYTVTRELLIVQLGTLTWNIRLEDITSVRKTRALMFGPALSLNGLEIHYGRVKSIMVSPRERDRFMKALGVGTRLQGWG